MNDDFYGGLGGEFVIATRFETSGAGVVRHEMGHNFGKVSEEYDGGLAYTGANSAQSLDKVTWKYWLTEPMSLVEQQSTLLYQKHIWFDLEQEGDVGAYDVVFDSTGDFSRWSIKISVSGADKDDSLIITLDGCRLDWKSNGSKDRTFYSWSGSTGGFSACSHTLRIQASGGQFDSSSAIIKQLCSADVYEYKGESEFKLENPEYIGIFPTFDLQRKKTYRPDNEKCLMRTITSTSFCAVCQENMWLQFLARVDFIDDLVVDGSRVQLKVIPLGQLRTPGDNFQRLSSSNMAQSAERYSVQWLNNGEEVDKFRDQVEVDLSGEVSGGGDEWIVRVTFNTPAIRFDPSGLMKSERAFII